ncbi:unnamed protein product [Diabrotica balteata]|uniref:CCDC93 N-terminal domain-containing protein n=1 Tax=Diabrotica balteata TaxID=107213 RepID=A0A9N9STE3_DIABA|nr:unnamed protein product [Diabrotica balteata]
MLRGHLIFGKTATIFSVKAIFCPMLKFPLNSRSMSNSTWQDSIHHTIPPTSLSNAERPLIKKIAVTEKIVAVLPKIKCPRNIEPHQIQVFDFIEIFPVIQWLVKRSLECREEVAAFVRACAI